jgi:hypothetical protein
MARMAKVVEVTECLRNENDSKEVATQKFDCLEQNWEFHAQLQSWYRSFIKKSTTVLYTSEPTTLTFAKPITDPELENVFPTSLAFPSFDIARTHCFYWAGLLRIYYNISILQPLTSVIRRQSLEVATLIAQSVQYLLSEEMQTRGPLNIFFPLSRAARAFLGERVKGDKESKEVRWCRLVFDELNERGFPFGRILPAWDWDDIPIAMSEGL